jgi:tripartite-type tricarboxylate transporter receptor subunit TctC
VVEVQQAFAFVIDVHGGFAGGQRMKRINLLVEVTVIASALAASAAALAAAQSEPPYPTRPIRMVVSAAPGSGGDIMARMFTPKLNEAWGQPVVVDNRAGAAGNLATDLVAKARPDGYTLLVRFSSLTTTPPFYPNLPYDPVRDFAPISLLTSSANVLVIVPGLGIKTVQELIRVAKAQPGKLNYASVGAGTLPHLVAELFKLRAGVDMTHIPYKSVAPSLMAQLGGEVQVNFPALLSGAGHIKSGRLWALAVTSLPRATTLPEVPTLDESGLPGFEAIAWYGLLAPAGTPNYIVQKTQREVARMVALPEFREALIAQGSEPVGSTPDEFAKRIRAELDQWRKLVKQAGLKLAE